jgi:hypothetical protein
MGNTENAAPMPSQSKAWPCSQACCIANIAIMRAFVQLRETIGSNKGLARRLNEVEKKYNSQVRVVFEAIRSEPGVHNFFSIRRLACFSSDPTLPCLNGLLQGT